MLAGTELSFIWICFEGFLYGFYSGIFAIYLQCTKKESRSAMIVFYVLCLLYLLSTVSVISDFLNLIFDIYYANALSLPLQMDLFSMDFRLRFVQVIAFGCCDVIAQFILIYRCWIVWGKNFRVVIVPSFLAIAFIVIWVVCSSYDNVIQTLEENSSPAWSNTTFLTTLALTMAVNILVTGLIVFKILKVFMEVKATSVERTLGSLSSTAGNPKLQHIIFIIIESGMALFAIQLVRIVLTSILISLPTDSNPDVIIGLGNALNYVISFHEMLNGIAPTIILVRVSMGLSFDDEQSFKEGVGSLIFYNPPSDPSTPALSSSGSIPLQGRNEDICFNNLTSDDTNSLWRVGSTTSSNIPPQERIEVM